MELKLCVGFLTLWILVISQLSTLKHVSVDDNVNYKNYRQNKYNVSTKIKSIPVQNIEDLRCKVKPVNSLELKNLINEERVNITFNRNFNSNELTFPTRNHGLRRSSHITHVTQKQSWHNKSLHKETDNIALDMRSRRNSAEATPEKVPYAVLLLRCDPDANCDQRGSGTLITLAWVLTSDRIIELVYKGVYVIQIYAGGNYESEVLEGNLAPGSQLRVSTTYHYSSENHLGLAKADKQFSETNTVRPISLAKKAWQWTTADSKEYGPFDWGLLAKCKVTYFSDVIGEGVIIRDYKRETRFMKVGLGCRCQFDDGHIKKTPFLCSAYNNSDFCAITGGAGLICEGSLRGVLDGVVEIDRDTNSCQINKKITYNCNEKFSTFYMYKYNDINTFLFYNTWRSREWINSYTNILPTTTKISTTITTTEMQHVTTSSGFLLSCSTVMILAFGFLVSYIM